MICSVGKLSVITVILSRPESVADVGAQGADVTRESKVLAV
jgi:hypothetical protein